MKKRQNTLIRDRDTGSLLELLMVTAVAAILISRGFLAIAGYPKIAPGGFILPICCGAVSSCWRPW